MTREGNTVTKNYSSPYFWGDQAAKIRLIAPWAGLRRRVRNLLWHKGGPFDWTS